jgi:hypothetical protein
MKIAEVEKAMCRSEEISPQRLVDSVQEHQRIFAAIKQENLAVSFSSTSPPGNLFSASNESG